MDAPSGDFLTSGRRDRQRAFRAARRHSRWVRFLRVGIPLFLVLGSAGLAAYQWLDPMRQMARLPVGADGMLLSGTKIVMRQPRLNGFTKDERPYRVKARTAAKDMRNPDALELEEIHATLVMPDKRDAVLTAREGFYDGKANTLRLHKDVVVTTPQYQVLLDEALLHIKAGNVVSEHPVVVTMLQGKINANRLEIHESGAVIKFDRGVTMVINGESAPQFGRMP